MDDGSAALAHQSTRIIVSGEVLPRVRDLAWLGDEDDPCYILAVAIQLESPYANLTCRAGDTRGEES